MSDQQHEPPPPYSPYSAEDASKFSNYPVKGAPAPEMSSQPSYTDSQNTQSATRVIQLPPVAIAVSQFGQFPVECDCRYCHAHIVTHTSKVAGALPWIVMGICFVLGFFLLIPWCICCIPFCIDSCLDVLHTCPACKRSLGRFSRI
uniref:LITAF domain-containing protein n=1 Tax=Panagrolaimus superbus TaxID=310955 RepID=A0A914ZBW2_9BILA